MKRPPKKGQLVWIVAEEWVGGSGVDWSLSVFRTKTEAAEYAGIVCNNIAGSLIYSARIEQAYAPKRKAGAS